MSYETERQRQYLRDVDAMAAQYRAATGRRDPFAERVLGSIMTFVGPRIRRPDARMPAMAMDAIVSGITRDNFHGRRREVADGVRRVLDGKLERDASLEGLDALIDWLDRGSENQSEDRRRAADRRRRAADRLRGRLGKDDQDDVDELEHFSSDRRRRAADRLRRRLGRDADAGDLEALRELERLESEDEYDEPVEQPGMGPVMPSWQSGEHPPAEDFDRGHHGRDRRSPARDFIDDMDRRRMGRDDPPDFPGKPESGGSMVPNRSSVDRPGYSEPRDLAAKDRRRRRYGADSAPPGGFRDRFRFTNNAVSSNDERRSMAVSVGKF